MTGVLSLVAAREEREPAAECVLDLVDGRRMYLYVAVYQHADEDHELHLWATDIVDAHQQVLSISRTLSVVGQLTRVAE